MRSTLSGTAAVLLMAGPRAERPALRKCAWGRQLPYLHHFLAALWLVLVSIPSLASVPDFGQVFDKHGVVMLLIDPASGQIVDANPAAADFYGHGRDVLKAMTIQQINALNAQQVADERTLAEKENRSYFIFRHRLASGEIRTVEVRSHPFDVDDRRLLLSMVHDITPRRDLDQGGWHYHQRLEELVEVRTAEAEAGRRTVLALLAGLLLTSALTLALVLATRRRRRAEADLQRSEALYRSLFHSNPHPMWVHDVETRRFLAANDAVVDHYGYSRDELLAMTVEDIRQTENLPSSRRNLPEQLMESVGDAGLSRLRKKDGSVIDVEITLHAMEFDGRRAKLVLAHDVTSERQAVRALIQFKHTLDQTLDCVFMFDAHDLRFFYVNEGAAQQLGYTRNELLELHPYDIKPEYPEPRFRELIAPLLSGEQKSLGLETVHQSKNGQRVSVEILLQYMKQDTEPGHFVAIVRDITARKRSELALALSSRRDQALLSLPDAADKLDEVAFMQFGQELAEQLTGSRIAFIHFVNDDQETIELVTWSRATLAHYCKATYDKHYPVSQAGIWADALRQRAPVVFNDYARAPNKHGLPEGHANLERLISVPVLEGGRVRMLTGVGNKPETYSEADVETVRLLGETIWRIVSKRRQQAELERKFAELRQWYTVMLGREGRILELKREVDALRQRLGEPTHFAEALADEGPGLPTNAGTGS